MPERCRARCDAAPAGAAPLPLERACIADTRLCRSHLLRATELYVPRRHRVERAAQAPPWLFPSAWRSQQLGQFSRRPAALSLVHLLGARCRWCESSDDLDHGAKWEWQHLSGFWADHAYTSATPLANASVAAAASALSVSPAARAAISRMPAAARGAPTSSIEERTENHCFKRGRARLLYADRRVLTISHESPSFRDSEAADDDGAAARVMIRRLLLLAALTGRMAVLPSFNCSAPWIRKATLTDGFRVVTDLRVVVTDVSRGLPVHLQRCAPCNVQFACRQHVLSEAQYAAATARVAAARRPNQHPLFRARLSLPLENTAPSSVHSELAAAAPSLTIDLVRVLRLLTTPINVQDATLADVRELEVHSHLADVVGDVLLFFHTGGWLRVLSKG